MRPLLLVDYWKGHSKPSEQQAKAAELLLERVNKLQSVYGEQFKINSGYRSPEHNARVGGAPNSAHISCEAVDIADITGSLKLFLTYERLSEFDLYMEHPDSTPGWAHLQTRKTRSGKRIFKP